MSRTKLKRVAGSERDVTGLEKQHCWIAMSPSLWNEAGQPPKV